MNVSYEGIGYLAVTLPNISGQAGKLCRVNPAGKVVACSKGDHFCGVVEAVDNDVAAVQVGGFAKVSVTGEVPPCGYLKLSADGEGGVQLNTNGKEYLVVESDQEAATMVLKL